MTAIRARHHLCLANVLSVSGLIASMVDALLLFCCRIVTIPFRCAWCRDNHVQCKVGLVFKRSSRYLYLEQVGGTAVQSRTAPSGSRPNALPSCSGSMGDDSAGETRTPVSWFRARYPCCWTTAVRSRQELHPHWRFRGPLSCLLDDASSARARSRTPSHTFAGCGALRYTTRAVPPTGLEPVSPGRRPGVVASGLRRHAAGGTRTPVAGLRTRNPCRWNTAAVSPAGVEPTSTGLRPALRPSRGEWGLGRESHPLLRGHSPPCCCYTT